MHNALWERNLNGFGFKTLVYFFAYFEGGFPLVVDRSYPADDGKIERRVPQLSELYFRRRFVDRMPMPYTSHLVPSPRMTRSPQPEPQVLFLNMGDFTLDMCARVWVDDYGKQFGRKLEMTELVYNTLNESGIDIPFPTRTVYMKN